MNKWTIVGLVVIALFIGLCLAVWLDLGFLFIILIVGFATGAYFLGAGKVKLPFLGFLARYGTVFFAFLFLDRMLLIFYPSFMNETRNLTAAAAGEMLSLLGAECLVAGPVIMLQNPSFQYDVTVGCVGSVLFCAYFALVLAVPGASSRQRLTGVFAGLVVLLVFNIFRIILTTYLEWSRGVHTHEYFYLFNMAFVLLVWAGWLRTLKPKSRDLPPGKSIGFRTSL